MARRQRERIARKEPVVRPCSLVCGKLRHGLPPKIPRLRILVPSQRQPGKIIPASRNLQLISHLLSKPQSLLHLLLTLPKLFHHHMEISFFAQGLCQLRLPCRIPAKQQDRARQRSLRSLPQRCIFIQQTQLPLELSYLEIGHMAGHALSYRIFHPRSPALNLPFEFGSANRLATATGLLHSFLTSQTEREGQSKNNA